MPTQREHSRNDWNSGATLQEINSGSLQRIADATELMAKPFLNLLAENERLKRDLEWYREKYAEKDRKISALRGVITKLKKKSK